MVKNNSIQFMQNKAENILNPCRYHLSPEAKKRLRWMYVIYYESDNNITTSANKIGISREWLSKLKNIFENNDKDPRSLEPQSRSPRNTDNRKRISEETEKKIIEIRKKHFWGKDKIASVVSGKHLLPVSGPTVNRYLHKHRLIDPKISMKNKQAYQNKKERDKRISLKMQARPPREIKDWKPGALIEKDMKLVPKVSFIGARYRFSEYFYSQHTLIDSFTRIRILALTEGATSRESKKAFDENKRRLPFPIAGINSDNGGENEGEFSQKLEKENILHFHSRAGTPTDNPRVERSHLTDEREFYQQGKIMNTFEKQKEEIMKWEQTYNFERPHQCSSSQT